jgi:hypothetical protein
MIGTIEGVISSTPHVRCGCGKNRGEIALDIKTVRSGQCGDVNPENPAKFADGAIEYPARVVVLMCTELDDASIVGFDRRQALPARGAHSAKRLRKRLI